MTPDERKLYEKEYRKVNAAKTKEYNKLYRELNKKELSKKRKASYLLNKENIKNKSKKYRKENPEKVSLFHKRYNQLNKDKLTKRRNERLATEPLFKLKKNIRSLIRQSFKQSGFRKTSKTAEILCCTFQEFKKHIEKQFESWMTWDNYGMYKPGADRTWNIDHKIPLASAKTEDELIKLNHYLNLRPLCSKENRDKWKY